MKWETEILNSPASYISNANWVIEESRGGTQWTPQENKLFESALALYDRDTSDRWHRVAAMVPGKTVRDVIKQYKVLELDVINIEAGLVPIPAYGAASANSSFTLDWVNSNGFKQSYGFGGERSSSGRTQSRKGRKEFHGQRKSISYFYWV